jgi:hypothetical protein
MRAEIKVKSPTEIECLRADGSVSWNVYCREGALVLEHSLGTFYVSYDELAELLPYLTDELAALLTNAVEHHRLAEPPKARPYATLLEAAAGCVTHGGKVRRISDQAEFTVLSLWAISVCLNVGLVNFYDLVEQFIWADDGSPCGIVEDGA